MLNSSSDSFNFSGYQYSTHLRRDCISCNIDKSSVVWYVSEYNFCRPPPLYSLSDIREVTVHIHESKRAIIIMVVSTSYSGRSGTSPKILWNVTMVFWSRNTTKLSPLSSSSPVVCISAVGILYNREIDSVLHPQSTSRTVVVGIVLEEFSFTISTWIYFAAISPSRTPEWWNNNRSHPIESNKASLAARFLTQQQSDRHCSIRCKSYLL